jgi:hypothetical protein
MDTRKKECVIVDAVKRVMIEIGFVASGLLKSDSLSVLSPNSSAENRSEEGSVATPAPHFSMNGAW